MSALEPSMTSNAYPNPNQASNNHSHSHLLRSYFLDSIGHNQPYTIDVAAFAVANIAVVVASDHANAIALVHASSPQHNIADIAVDATAHNIDTDILYIHSHIDYTSALAAVHCHFRHAVSY